MIDTVYVIDTETSTTHFADGIPNGHIVEIGVAKVNLRSGVVIPLWNFTVCDPTASPDAWIFHNSDLAYDEVMHGVSPEIVDRFLGYEMDGHEVTSFNIPFDSRMMARDLPNLAWRVKWGQDLMVQAAKITEIPRRHAGGDEWPTAEATYNYLCPQDPCNLLGKEKHRALADAEMEGYILLELYLNGLYHPLEARK